MFIRNERVENIIQEYLENAYIPKDYFDNKMRFVFGGAVIDAFDNSSKPNDIDLISIEDYEKIPSFFYKEDEGSVSNNFGLKSITGKHKNSKISVDFIQINKEEDKSITMLLKEASEVDINVSALLYHPNYGFLEALPKVYTYCLKQIYKVNKNVSGYSLEKTPLREKKMLDKGWLKV